MPGIAPPPDTRGPGSRYRVVMPWVVVAVGSYAAMLAWPGWVTIGVCVLWVGLGILAVGWHARRGQQALRAAEQRAEESRSLLECQERFILDASHELRTPATIARGHLELLRRNLGASPELDVALDELGRMGAILERLLVLARADQPDFVVTAEVELEPLLEDVFMRWADVAPRAWRLGPLARGRLLVDGDRLRAALDALLENAVKYSEPRTAIELRAVYDGDGWVSIEVEDEGCGVPDAALERIFDRFARADPARTRSAGGVGLGLAIVDTIAKAHGGTSTVTTKTNGSIFALRLPGFTRTAIHMTVPGLGWEHEAQPSPVAESLTGRESMTSTGAPREGLGATGPAGVDWTLRGLIARHKRFSLGALAAILVMLAVFVVTVVGPSAGSVTDSTTCSGWGSSNQDQQRAYASSYVTEHGPLKSGATDPASVEAAINKGCGQAFENDVADSINVYQAINNQY